jgi:pilus assembly protein Flp/PilA
MTEYIIIVALIAIGAIFVVTVFGDNIRALFGTAANSLAGQPATIEGTPVDESATKKDLKNFGEGP